MAASDSLLLRGAILVLVPVTIVVVVLGMNEEDDVDEEEDEDEVMRWVDLLPLAVAVVACIEELLIR